MKKFNPKTKYHLGQVIKVNPVPGGIFKESAVVVIVQDYAIIADPEGIASISFAPMQVDSSFNLANRWSLNCADATNADKIEIFPYDSQYYFIGDDQIKKGKFTSLSPSPASIFETMMFVLTYSNGQYVKSPFGQGESLPRRKYKKFLKFLINKLQASYDRV